MRNTRRAAPHRFQMVTFGPALVPQEGRSMPVQHRLVAAPSRTRRAAPSTLTGGRGAIAGLYRPAGLTRDRPLGRITWRSYDNALAEAVNAAYKTELINLALHRRRRTSDRRMDGLAQPGTPARSPRLGSTRRVRGRPHRHLTPRELSNPALATDWEPNRGQFTALPRFSGPGMEVW